MTPSRNPQSRPAALPVLHPLILQKMMFVSGEAPEPNIDTIALIESIVQQQVREILKRGTEITNRQGQRSIGVTDILYIIRDNKAKLHRVKQFLSWKDVRKNVKESNDDGKGDDLLPEDAGAGAAGPNDMVNRGAMTKTKKAQIKLPWDVHSFYAHPIPERENADDDGLPGDAGEDSDMEMNATTLQRLRNADERTKHMTKDQYVHWSECRQASFTFRKGKRFREWAGFGLVTDSKPSDDVIDILGFLTYEIVEWLTNTALKVKSAEEAEERRQRARAGAQGQPNGGGGAANGGEDGEEGDASAAEGQKSRKRKREMGMSLFAAEEEEKTPLLPKHIQEAFRLSQQPTMKDRRFSGLRRPGWQPHLKLI